MVKTEKLLQNNIYLNFAQKNKREEELFIQLY